MWVLEIRSAHIRFVSQALLARYSRRDHAVGGMMRNCSYHRQRTVEPCELLVLCVACGFAISIRCSTFDCRGYLSKSSFIDLWHFPRTLKMMQSQRFSSWVETVLYNMILERNDSQHIDPSHKDARGGPKRRTCFDSVLYQYFRPPSAVYSFHG